MKTCPVMYPHFRSVKRAENGICAKLFSINNLQLTLGTLADVRSLSLNLRTVPHLRTDASRLRLYFHSFISWLTKSSRPADSLNAKSRSQRKAKAHFKGLRKLVAKNIRTIRKSQNGGSENGA